MAGFYQKIAAVMQACGSIERDGTNSHHKYTYTSAEAVKRAVQTACAAQGLAMITTIERLEGSTFDRVMCKAALTVTDGEHSISAEGIGSGTDRGDKASMKACTAAVKYALAHLFCLPFGDDPEADARTDIDAAQRQRAKTKKSGGSTRYDVILNRSGAAAIAAGDDAKAAAISAVCVDLVDSGHVSDLATCHAEITKRLGKNFDRAALIKVWQTLEGTQ